MKAYADGCFSPDCATGASTTALQMLLACLAALMLLGLAWWLLRGGRRRSWPVLIAVVLVGGSTWLLIMFGTAFRTFGESCSPAWETITIHKAPGSVPLDPQEVACRHDARVGYGNAARIAAWGVGGATAAGLALAALVLYRRREASVSSGAGEAAESGNLGV